MTTDKNRILEAIEESMVTNDGKEIARMLKEMAANTASEKHANSFDGFAGRLIKRAFSVSYHTLKAVGL